MAKNIYTTLTPKFDPTKGRWVVDIPKSLNGVRSRRFFASQQEALRASGTIAVAHSIGESIAIGTKGTSIGSFAAEFLGEKKAEVAKDTYRQLAWGVTMFVEKFGKLSPADVTERIAKRWVEGLPDLSTRGKFNVFAVCKSFYRWHGMRGVCRDNPFFSAPAREDAGYRVAILAPAQMRTLLATEFPPWFRTYLVCGGFAGLRTIEMLRMDHESIDWDYKEVLVRKTDSKQGEAAKPRSIGILPAFERHMPRDLAGPLLGGYTEKRMRKCLATAKEVLKVDDWLKNSLRHSFASYHLAQFRDAAKTAFELGHESPKLLYKVYANLVSRRDAERWWEL
jgi:integrase